MTQRSHRPEPADGPARADRAQAGPAPSGDWRQEYGRAWRDSEGWIWGDEGAVIPGDAPLPALMSVALRLLGAFFEFTAQSRGVSAGGLAVLRLLAARDGLKSSEVAARGWWTPGTVTSLADTLVRLRGTAPG